MEDAQIVDLYLNRQESALQETARKYGPYLNQVADHILRCREDSEEVVEDTYLAAWNAIPPEVPRVLKHFLSRIARNLSFNRLDYLTARQRDSHMVLLLSELDACIPDTLSDPARQLESRQIGASLNHFLSTLPPKDCAVFLCRYYHSMTIREIGDKYALSERNVKYRLSCMRQQLRRELEKEGICV